MLFAVEILARKHCLIYSCKIHDAAFGACCFSKLFALAFGEGLGY